jgi:uncharacterized protein YbjT (DUF2867 family)
MNVLVTGASGFVGTHLTRHLVTCGHTVVALSRSGNAYPHSGVTPARGDVVTGDGLDAAMRGIDAVVHLVGIIREQGQDGTFERVHVGGTRHVIQAAQNAAVDRLVHMSALGARSGTPSAYFETKARAEALVKSSSLNWTVLRPSIIFGEGDDFFGGNLKTLVTTYPLIPQVGNGHYPFRPIWVGDVARAFEQSLWKPETARASFDLAGPTEYTLRDLLELMKSALGIHKPVVPVPAVFMKLGVPVMQFLPKPPITRDELIMLLYGSTADLSEALAVFDLDMLELPSKLPAILGVA